MGDCGCKGDGRLAPNRTGSGSGRPDAVTTTSLATSSVNSKNSLTRPVTVTSSPSATDGAVLVNTKRPSDVSGFPSPAPTAWMKKPSANTAVTTLPTVLRTLPATGEATPGPWISPIRAS